MNLLHLSDIHYRDRYKNIETGYLSVLAKMTSPLVNLKKCFDLIDKSKIDGVVITGDLTEEGTELDYRKLKLFLDAELGNLPLCVTLGNHDNKQAFRKGWGLSSTNQDAYEPYNTTCDLLDVKIISLDNAISGFPNGAVTNEQYLWLKNQLNVNKGRKTILIFHHNLFSDQDNIPPAYWDSDFYNLISENEMIGILCGHSHHQFTGYFAGKPYTTAPSMSFRGKSCINRQDVEFEEYPGYQICHFTKTGMTVNPFYLYKEPLFIKTVSMGTTKI